MMNIAIFMLIGLSLFGNGGYCVDVDATASGSVNVQPGGAPGPNDCLVRAVKNSYDLLVKLRGVLCMYKPDEADPKAVQNFIDEVKMFAKDAQCTVKQITGVELDLKAQTDDITVTIQSVLDKLTPTLDDIGLVKPVLNLVCSLISPLVQSKCLQSLLQDTIPRVVGDLTSPAAQLKCSVEGGLNVENAKKALIQATCTVGDALNIPQLQTTTEDIRKMTKNDLTKLINDLLNNELISKTLATINCAVSKVLGNVLGKKGALAVLA